MIGRRKARHMTGCARYMHDRAPDYGLDPDAMYILGLLHDVGYLHGRHGHEETGAAIAERLGLPEELREAIRLHGRSLALYGISEDADGTPDPGGSDIDRPGGGIPHVGTRQPPPELILIVEADLSVDSGGRITGVGPRLDDIRSRYGNCLVGTVNAEYIRQYCRKHEMRSPEDFMTAMFGTDDRLCKTAVTSDTSTPAKEDENGKPEYFYGQF